ASVARVGSFPYHHPFESGGGSGPSIGELPLAGDGKGECTAAQAPALAPVAPGQPSARAGTTKTAGAAGQQDGHGTGLGVEGNFLSLLALQVRPLGRSVSRLLVRTRHAQPFGAHEESRPHASRS